LSQREKEFEITILVPKKRIVYGSDLQFASNVAKVTRDSIQGALLVSVIELPDGDFNEPNGVAA
jgi:hypothetical protein